MIRNWLSMPKRLFDLENKVESLENKMALDNEPEPKSERFPRGAIMPLWLQSGVEVSIGGDNYWLAVDTPVFGEKVYELERWGLLAEGKPRVGVGDLVLSLGDQALSSLRPPSCRHPQPRKVVEVRGSYARLQGAIVFEPMRALRVVERAEDTTKNTEEE